MGSKIISLIGYILYFILFSFLLYFGLKHQNELYKQAGSTYDMTKFFRFSTFFPILIGACLALPHIIKSLLKQGNWKFNWIYFIFLGLTSFYLTIVPYLYAKKIITVKLPFSTIYFNGHLGSTVTTLTTIIGIAAGYFVLTSFEKKSVNESVNHTYFS